ncbi:MAG: head GIN domain-containing protein [Chitinophagaceae bacterium]
MKLVQFCLLLLPAFVLAQQPLANDPNAENRPLAGSFRAIQLSNSFDCYLTQGSKESVVVSAATPEIRDHIRVEQENGILKIRFDEPEKFWKYLNSKKLKVYINYKDIDQLTASGVCDVYINGKLQADDLTLHFSGASELQGAIQAKQLTVYLSGASNMDELSGKADEVSIEASGASRFNAFNLVAQNVAAKASGASDIRITANRELNVRATGASKIQYKGDGKITDIKTSGAGTVNRREN